MVEAVFDSSRFDPLAVAVATVRKHVRELDASGLSAERAVALVDVFAEVERLGAAGKAIAAAAVAATNGWHGSGERSPVDWLANRTGSTVGAARGALSTAQKLAAAPDVDAA